jgi:hypothetical protein
MVLFLLSYVVTIAGAVAALAPLRQWVHSSAGIESVRRWPVTAVIPLQTAIALLWLQALFSFPWLAWKLSQIVGDPWWSMLRSAQVVFLLVFTPLSVALVGDSWLRLHPLPPFWSLQRILLGGFAAVAIVTTIMYLPVDGANEVGGLMFIFAVLTTLFLARWWFITHPIRRETDPRSSPPTA